MAILGNPLVGGPAAIISYVKSNAIVDYVLPIADIKLEFNSKNKQPTDIVTATDVFVANMDYSREFTDSVTLAEEIIKSVQYNLEFTESLSTSETFSWTSIQNITETIGTGDTPGIGDIFHVNPADGISVSDEATYLQDGMLNTNMLNTRLISAGSTEVTRDDVVIT
jgi:hypothetical protein